ncbi:hypothetical protein [Nocardioides ferulae]|uniref:hypothetical protein n=1 Tax=Nocardioides ferulae TaxID=2340821 RepID=UPI000F889A18|nr:hypothetical protein [Nocardioides ferulae]
MPQRPFRTPTRLGILASAAALLLGSFAVPSPAAADVYLEWDFVERPVGLPASDVAARTLESVELWHNVAGWQNNVALTVTLGATPDETSDADLHLALGVRDDTGACRTRWQIVVPTLDPGPFGQREEAVLTSRQSVSVSQLDWKCGSVSLTAAGDPGTVYDRLDGRPQTGAVIGDPLPIVVVRSVDTSKVRVRRWSPVRVRLVSAGLDVAVARVAARRIFLQSTPTASGPIPPFAERTVTLWVRPRSCRATMLRLRGTAFTTDGQSRDFSNNYRMRPCRGRSAGTGPGFGHAERFAPPRRPAVP